MTKEELAYLAGIIDGEGYVGITNNKKNYQTYTLQLTVVSSNIKLVNWLVQSFGFSFTLRKNYKTSLAKKQVYQCTVRCGRVLEILKLVSPYLIIKKPKADLLLSEWPEKYSINREKRTEVYNRIRQLTKEA